MGYNSYILICGTDQKGNDCELSYWESGGSYSGVHNHYLYMKAQESSSYSYCGKQKMGDHQQVIYYEYIKDDYESYKLLTKDVKESVINIIETENDNFAILYKLENYVNKMLAETNNENYYDELVYIYEKCTNFVNDGYNNVKVIYGIIA